MEHPLFSDSTGTPVRLKTPDYLGLKTQTSPDHSLKNARWVSESLPLPHVSNKLPRSYYTCLLTFAPFCNTILNSYEWITSSENRDTSLDHEYSTRLRRWVNGY